MKLQLEKILFTIRILLVLLLPLMFTINIYLFTVALIIFLCLFLFDRASMESKLFAILLNSFVYSGLIIKGLHIYDCVLIIFFLFYIIKYRKFIIPKKYSFFIFLFSILLCFFSAINPNSMVELTRYFLSFLAFILIYNINFDFKYIVQTIYEVINVNVYNAIIVFILFSRGLLKNYATSLISSDVFLYTGEVRLNGFFSDPNKYFTFCLFLLILLQLPIFKEKKNKLYGFIAIISCLISMSRTSLICVFLFLLFLLIKSSKKYLSYQHYIVFTFLSLSGFILLFFLIYKLNLIEQLYVFSARIMGRSQTIKLNASLTEDNRTLIWKKAIRLILERPMIGSGLQAFTGLLPYPTHNTILSLLLDGGLLLLISFINFFKKLCFNDYAYVIIPLLVVPMFFLDLGNYRILFIAYALILKQLLIDKQYRVQEKKDEYCNIN